MASPDPIANRYKRYKAGTDKLTRWLYLKSRPNNQDSDLSPAVTLSTQGLLRLAEQIASATPKVDIPLEMIVITEDVIEGRLVCADWYSASSDGSGGETEQKNSSHRNFITVLNQILAFLQSAYDRQSTRKEKAKGITAKCKADILQNIYEYLDVEEPASNSSDLGSTSAHEPSSSPKRTQVKIGEVEDADKTFATWCFFKDQYDVCQFLQNLWQRHMAGEVNLCTVCEVTHKALELMEKTGDQLTKDYPCFDRIKNVIDFLGFEAITIMNESRVWCFVGPTKLINGRNRTHRLAYTLRALVPEIMVMWNFGKKVPILTDHGRPRPFPEEVFSEGLINSCFDEFIPPWLVTACQAYMHIYDALGNHIAGAHDQLHRHASTLREMRDAHASFARTHGPPTFSVAKHMVFVAGIESHLKFYVDKDIVSLLQKETPYPELQAPSPPYQMQKLLPVPCGKMIHEQQLDLYLGGLQACNSGFVVLAAAHFYRAAEICGGIRLPWQSMDWFLARHGEQQKVVPDLKGSTTPFAMLARHYRVALGAKPSKRSTRSAGLPDAKTFTRVTGGTSRFQYGALPTTLQSAKKGHIFGDQTSSPYMAHYAVEYRRTLTDGSMQRNPDEHALHKVAYAALDQQNTALDVAGKRVSKGAQHRKVTGLQLLESYADMLLQDEASFNFDYFAFTRECHGLLSKVIRGYWEMIGMMPYEAVNTMLWELAHTEQYARGTPKLEHTMICGASSHLNEHFEREGCKLLNEAKARSGSNMPLPSTVPCSDTGYVFADILPPVTIHDVETLTSYHVCHGVDFHLDRATNTVMLYNPMWKDNKDARRHILRSFGGSSPFEIEDAMRDDTYIAQSIHPLPQGEAAAIHARVLQNGGTLNMMLMGGVHQEQHTG
ncbi:hypothetical protein LTR56_014668 [Elasticomyces elasticus]|nr:hypothetical protein LTR56_014668 [Elasticomyces elasticus]KAK3645345.1 hypothetical protein LTR22_014810 [Elasticomyces elasticus]KAK4919814.1 hypothetical protein LTR49_012561 [Elasticomyces elasticus]KAK5750116.1 hypothetical protein LTS12_019842 [Elasticomyces elasticus]